MFDMLIVSSVDAPGATVNGKFAAQNKTETRYPKSKSKLKPFAFRLQSNTNWAQSFARILPTAVYLLPLMLISSNVAYTKFPTDDISTRAVNTPAFLICLLDVRGKPCSDYPIVFCLTAHNSLCTLSA